MYSVYVLMHYYLTRLFTNRGIIRNDNSPYFILCTSTTITSYTNNKATIELKLSLQWLAYL